MRVLYLTQVFETEEDPGSDRHFFLCRYLVSKGHNVTAMTSNVDYKRAIRKYPGPRRGVRRDVAGIDVRYVYSYANFRGSFSKRFLYYLTFVAAALLESGRLERADLVYAVSTPLTVGLLGLALARIHRAPFVFEVTDVWPDAAVAVGLVNSRAVIRLASWIEKLCYRNAAAIVALTEGIRENIRQKGASPERLFLATNGVDASLFGEDKNVEMAAARLREESGYGERLVCMYLGAHGAYNALGTILEAANTLRHDARFLFVLVGDGDEKSSLVAACQERGLENVVFFPPVPRSKTPQLLRSADIFLLPNRRGTFFEMNLPNKLFDFLASARPIVVAGKGESADAVRAAGAGLVVAAEDGKGMASAVVELAALNAAGRAAMGTAGRAYVSEKYDRKKICDELVLELSQTVERLSPVAPGTEVE